MSRRALAPLVAALVAVALGGCSSSSAVDPAEVTGVPASWLEKTAEGWPSSSAFGANMPVLSRGECLLGDPPKILGDEPETTDVGWGGYGDDSSDENAYRYLCGLHSSGRYAGELQLIQAGSAEDALSTVAEFQGQPSTDVQDNTVTTVQSGQLEVHVLRRWYPTNPQGAFQALYHDEQANAIVALEVNSLDEADFEAYSEQQVADDLVSAMASAG